MKVFGNFRGSDGIEVEFGHILKIAINILLMDLRPCRL
jgi:hypothetical protein